MSYSQPQVLAEAARASKGLLAVVRAAEPGARAEAPLQRWPSMPARSSQAEEALAFSPSGRRKQPGQCLPASRSAFGVLQLAYFSMRYGLLPATKARGILPESYPAPRLGSTPKTASAGYFRHRTRPTGYPRGAPDKPQHSRRKPRRGLIGLDRFIRRNRRKRTGLRPASSPDARSGSPS